MPFDFIVILVQNFQSASQYFLISKDYLINNVRVSNNQDLSISDTKSIDNGQNNDHLYFPVNISDSNVYLLSY